MKKLLLISLFIILFIDLFSQNNSQFISQSVPPSVGLSESFSVSVTFKNTGTTTWKSSDGYKLGTQSPQDNTIWGVGTRVALPNSVAPGTQVTFNVELTSPGTGDGYGVVLQWRMLQEVVTWFGDVLEKTIEVSKTTGIRKQNTLKKFNIYPNPISLNETIEIDGTFNKYDRIVLASINGNIVFEKVIQENANNFSLHIQKNSNIEGIYIIQIISYNSTNKKNNC
jgi:hypothetical protein